MKKFNEINKQIALFGVSKIGSMGFFYFCIILVTIPLFLPKTELVVQYISSGFLQLIFLPLIMVGQKLQGLKDQKKLDEILEQLLGDERQELEEMQNEQKILHEETIIMKDEDKILHEIKEKL